VQTVCVCVCVYIEQKQTHKPMAKTTEDQVVDMKKALEQCMDDADMLEELLVVMVEEMSVKLKVIGKAVVSNKHAVLCVCVCVCVCVCM